MDMYNHPDDTGRQTYSVSEPTPYTDFLPVDSVFAWLSFLLAYLYSRATPVASYPLGGFLFVVLLYGTAFCIACIRKARISAFLLLSGIAAMVICGALLLTESAFLCQLSFTFAIANYCYFLYIAFGNNLEKGFSNLILMDYLKALFVLPFGSLTQVFRAIKNDRSNKGWAVVTKVLLGLAITFIPTLVIFVCLSYDDGFRKLLSQLLDLNAATVFSHLGSLVLSVPMAMYGFGLYYACVHRKKQDTMTAAGCRRAMQGVRIMPAITAVSAVIPIVFLYVVFFISQWQYYVGAFTGSLPAHFSYAEYARSGFFELCAVSVINFVLILLLRLLMHRDSPLDSAILRILTCVFCLCTLILISTAIAKLWMYIDCYGLTQKRIYAMWLMVVIGLVYLIVAVGQFIPGAKLVAVGLSICIVLFGVLCLCNVNQVVARYNLDRHLNGTLEQMDTALIEEMGDSAIPEVCRYIEIMDQQQRPHTQIYDELKQYLTEQKQLMELREESLFSWNIPYYQAQQALTQWSP